jgi:hypothetical protein
MFCSSLISCCFLPPDTNFLNGTLSEEVIKLSDLTILSIGTSTLLLVAFVVDYIWPYSLSLPLPLLAAQNNLSGTLTTQLGQMVNLQSLRLRKSNHSRTRTLRTWSGPCPHSTPFNLSCCTEQNNFDGSIPTELGLLTNMEYLFLGTMNCDMHNLLHFELLFLPS